MGQVSVSRTPFPQLPANEHLEMSEVRSWGFTRIHPGERGVHSGERARRRLEHPENAAKCIDPEGNSWAGAAAGRGLGWIESLNDFLFLFCFI